MTEQDERDERAIARVLHIYAVAMDSRRWDLFDIIFAPDVTARYPSSEWTSCAAFKKDFADMHAGFDATQHALMTPIAEIDGDRAASFSYCSFRLIKRGTPGGDFVEGHAWYDDHWIRASKGWLIKERNCRIVWADGNPAIMGRPLEWNPMRVDAAEGKIEFLNLLDKRLAKATGS